MAGWISLHRQIQEHWLYKEPRIFSKYEAWIDLLLMASHKDNKFVLGNEVVQLEKGEFITSELKLMEKWRWSKSKLRAYLLLLERDGMIVKKTDQKKTAISIVNYSVYQKLQTTEEPQADHKQTTDRPRADTINNVNNENKGNKGNKDKSMSVKPTNTKKFVPPSHDEVIAYCQERGNNVDADRFINFYASKGWLIGKALMKDWRAAVRTWEKNDYRKNVEPRSYQKETVNERNNRLLDEFFGGDEPFDRPRLETVIEHDVDKL